MLESGHGGGHTGGVGSGGGGWLLLFMVVVLGGNGGEGGGGGGGEGDGNGWSLLVVMVFGKIMMVGGHGRKIDKKYSSDRRNSITEPLKSMTL